MRDLKPFPRIRHIGLFALLSLVAVAVAAFGWPTLPRIEPATRPQGKCSPLVLEQSLKPRGPQRVRQPGPRFGHLPITFEPNQGQANPSVKFIARSGGVTTFLTTTEAVFSLPIANSRLPKGPSNEADVGDPDRWNLAPRHFGGLNFGVGLSAGNHRDLRRPESAIANRQSTITMKLVGASPNAIIEGVDRLHGISNYFIGAPTMWRTNIPHYAKVRYRDIYPGIDLVYYGNPDQLEFDVVVAAGVDPQSFLMAFDGADHLSINENGDLVMDIAGSQILQHKPQVYQWIKGKQRNVAGEYRLTREMQVAFSVGDHDVTKPVFIDPVLSFSFTFTGRGLPSGIVLDSAGSAYLTGWAGSDFQTTPGAFQTTGDENGNGFVAKLNPEGTELIYSTFLGGTGNDFPQGITVDQNGNAHVAGSTNSNDFPTTSGAFQPFYANGEGPPPFPLHRFLGPPDAFVTKLNPTGTVLVYSTYLGGKGGDSAAGIAIDSAGNAYITGTTYSTDFPITPSSAFQTSNGGNDDVFVAKLNPIGSALVYSTYLGGGRGGTC